MKDLNERKLLFGLDIDNPSTPRKLLLYVLLAWAGSAVGVYLLFLNFSWTERGQFGDMFGAINALFSGLAFAGIILTILLQREELKAQREELKLTRKELKLTRREAKEQNDTLHLQRLDNTFFNMLTLHNQILTALDMFSFRDVLSNLYMAIDEGKMHYEQSHLSHYEDQYYETIRSYGGDFSSYLQSLAAIFSLIERSDLLLDSERIYYYSILKNYISIKERVFLFYHLALWPKDETLVVLLGMKGKLGLFTTLEKEEYLDKSHLFMNRRDGN